MKQKYKEVRFMEFNKDKAQGLLDQGIAEAEQILGDTS